MRYNELGFEEKLEEGVELFFCVCERERERKKEGKVYIDPGIVSFLSEIGDWLTSERN